jgi:hypothetical protein
MTVEPRNGLKIPGSFSAQSARQVKKRESAGPTEIVWKTVPGTDPETTLLNSELPHGLTADGIRHILVHRSGPGLGSNHGELSPPLVETVGSGSEGAAPKMVLELDT